MSIDEPNDVLGPEGGLLILTDADRAVLERVEDALSDGLALRRWWEQVDSSEGYSQRFELVRQYNQPSEGFGFYGEAPYRGGILPVMGVVDIDFFDRAKTIPGQRLDEFREFLLHYFLRVSSFRLPEASVEQDRRVAELPFRRLGWCSAQQAQRRGFGYNQLYFKSSVTGEVGKFEGAEQYAIVDLREIGPTYEWIVLKVRIFDFDITVQPFGRDSPKLVFTLDEESYLVISRAFVTNRESPAEGVLGEYGFGYAFLKDPSEGSQTAYGPGNFDAAFQLITFRVLEGGEILSKLVFVANRPVRLVDLSIDPVGWGLALADFASFGLVSRLLFPDGVRQQATGRWRTGFDPVLAGISLVNGVTGGLAARQFCISREELERRFLVQHFMKHYETLTGAVLTWRQIADWRDESKLPRWVTTGFSS